MCVLVLRVCVCVCVCVRVCVCVCVCVRARKPYCASSAAPAAPRVFFDATSPNRAMEAARGGGGGVGNTIPQLYKVTVNWHELRKMGGAGCDDLPEKSVYWVPDTANVKDVLEQCTHQFPFWLGKLALNDGMPTATLSVLGDEDALFASHSSGSGGSSSAMTRPRQMTLFAYNRALGFHSTPSHSQSQSHSHSHTRSRSTQEASDEAIKDMKAEMELMCETITQQAEQIRRLQESLEEAHGTMDQLTHTIAALTTD